MLIDNNLKGVEHFTNMSLRYFGVKYLKKEFINSWRFVYVQRTDKALLVRLAHISAISDLAEEPALENELQPTNNCCPEPLHTSNYVHGGFASSFAYQVSLWENYALRSTLNHRFSMLAKFLYLA